MKRELGWINSKGEENGNVFWKKVPKNVYAAVDSGEFGLDWES